MASVVFDLPTFRARYPEFASVTDATLAAYFSEACLYLANDATSKVADLPTRSTLLNMLVAHVAALSAAALVGRISSATEGSVTVSTDPGPAPGSAAWYGQTKYGAAYWQATVAYRTFRFFARPYA